MVSKNIERLRIRIRIFNQNGDPDPRKKCGSRSTSLYVGIYDSVRIVLKVDMKLIDCWFIGMIDGFL